ncbi:MAG: hypothetical protein RJB26_1839 [Pseudomonadota bacterium]|jgi:hypothetical protein
MREIFRGLAGMRLALWCLPLLFAGCGASQVRPVDRSPTPLVEPLALDAGLYLDDEYRHYVYKEKRWNVDWQVALGEAAVAHATRMAKASFRTVREVKSLQAPGEPAVPLLLAPRVEEFAFVTPRDAGGVLYQVTLRFRMNVHDAQGRLVDSLVYTGYGATAGGSSLGSEGPLTVATELALRDAGAKFLTEFPLQPVVQQLVHGEAPTPVPVAVPVPAAPQTDATSSELPAESAAATPKETP